jgi:hypothetical protein
LNFSYNKPDEYHNGGVWPFICGMHVAALVAARKYTLAEKQTPFFDEVRSCSQEYHDVKEDQN